MIIFKDGKNIDQECRLLKHLDNLKTAEERLYNLARTTINFYWERIERETDFNLSRITREEIFYYFLKIRRKINKKYPNKYKMFLGPKKLIPLIFQIKLEYNDFKEKYKKIKEISSNDIYKSMYGVTFVSIVKKMIYDDIMKQKKNYILYLIRKNLKDQVDPHKRLEYIEISDIFLEEFFNDFQGIHEKTLAGIIFLLMNLNIDPYNCKITHISKNFKIDYNSINDQITRWVTKNNKRYTTFTKSREEILDIINLRINKASNFIIKSMKLEI